MDQVNENATKNMARVRKTMALIANNEKLICNIESALSSINSKLMRALVEPPSLDLYYCGDKEVLHTIFKELAKLEFHSTSRPGKKFTVFTSYFEHKDPEKREDFKIWLNFSSTVCERKVVGSKMVREDVYEVICV